MLPRLSAPVSGVDCPYPFFHANSLLLASLLSSRNSLLLASLLSSRQLPSAGSRRQLSFASPYHFRIRRDFMSKNLVSRQNRQLNRLLWQPNHIVLHTSLSCPCHLFSINYNTIQQQAEKQEHLQEVTTEITKF